MMVATVQAATQQNSEWIAWGIAHRHRGLVTEPVTTASTSTTVTGSTSIAKRLGSTEETVLEA